MCYNVGCMASKGVREIPCQVTRKVETDYKPSQTTETLIGYYRVLAHVIPYPGLYQSVF